MRCPSGNLEILNLGVNTLGYPDHAPDLPLAAVLVHLSKEMERT
jgi:hypothetical protein